jgi:hypothetical protein
MVHAVLVPLLSRRTFLSAAWVLLVFGSPAPTRAVDLQLPDLIAWARESTIQSQCYMYCGTIDNTFVANKVVYRFNGALPNIGEGPLEIREVTHPDATQDVYQRIFDTEGGITERLIGSFPDSFAFEPRHLYLPGIARYNLREVLSGNGVGEVLASMDKISMAVVDSVAYYPPPQNAAEREYISVSADILGISVGWVDSYSRGLPGQWIEVTDLTPGDYWLEVTADPDNRIQEFDETNNTTRILVTLGAIPEPQDQPGDFNRDGDVDAADYVYWRNTLGEIYPPPENQAGIRADGNANHRVDAPDYDVWRSHFGIVNPGSAATATVPEPTTAALLFVLLILTACRGRRGASH